MKPVKTIEDVAVEINRAVLVLKALPYVGPRKISAFWPEFASEETNDNMEYFKPMPGEIDDMDIVFERWMKGLNFRDKRLVFYRGAGCSWKKIQYIFKMSRSGLYERYLHALKKILKTALQDQRNYPEIYESNEK